MNTIIIIIDNYNHNLFMSVIYKVFLIWYKVLLKCKVDYYLSYLNILHHLGKLNCTLV